VSLDSTFGSPRQYSVRFNGYRWLCNCPWFLKHAADPNFVCKHVVAVLKTIAAEVTVEKPLKKIECDECKLYDHV
jgi:uncharacterized Zn finger protein